MTIISVLFVVDYSKRFTPDFLLLTRIATTVRIYPIRDSLLKPEHTQDRNIFNNIVLSNAMKNSNILLITIDALRADRVLTRHDSELTPVLNSIADQGRLFTSCYACSDKTTTSIPTIQTGLYPTRHGLLSHGPAVTQKQLEHFSSTISIQEILRDSHTTICCDTLGDIITRGFDHVYPEKSLPVKLGKRILEPLPTTFVNKLSDSYSRLNERGRDNKTDNSFGASRPEEYRARWITDKFIDTIRNEDDSWFGYVHYWDTHMEYTSEKRHKRAVADRVYEDGDVTIEELKREKPDGAVAEKLDTYSDITTVGDLKRQYDAAVRCVDEYIGQIYEHLKQTGELSDTLIIITSDHGESLTENGVFFDHRELYDPTWHVPLLIHGPEFSGREDQFVQHFDIVPTILDYLDIPHKSTQFDGRPLSPTEDSLNRDAVFAEQTHNARQRAIRTTEYKYIRNLHEERPGRLSEMERPPEQLYDLNGSAGETINIASDNQDICEELNATLEQWLDSVPDPEQTTSVFEHPEEDDELMDQLDALGYKFD